jgi:hypothetical protein
MDNDQVNQLISFCRSIGIQYQYDDEYIYINEDIGMGVLIHVSSVDKLIDLLMSEYARMIEHMYC